MEAFHHPYLFGNYWGLVDWSNHWFPDWLSVWLRCKGFSDCIIKEFTFWFIDFFIDLLTERCIKLLIDVLLYWINDGLID